MRITWAGVVGGICRVLQALGLVILFFALAALMHGCGYMPSIGKTELVKVEVPVPVPCRAPLVQEPFWPMTAVKPDADVHTLAKNALAEIERRREYEVQLRAALDACR